MMSEFLAAIVGGFFTLGGTFLALWFQFKKEDREKMKDYRNDLVSSLDIVTYKASKVRNNYLDFIISNYNKEQTFEIYQDIENDFKSLDNQIQNLILLMSHHSDNSNSAIQQFLTYYEPVENQFNKFKVAFKIYSQQCDEVQFDKNWITYSKRKLDFNIGEFANRIKSFAKNEYNHILYEPSLNELVNKNDAIKKN